MGFPGVYNLAFVLMSLLADNVFSQQRVWCEERNRQIRWDHLCRYESQCEDESDDKYCQSRGYAISLGLHKDYQTGWHYVYDRLVPMDICLGPYNSSICEEAYRKDVNCLRCLEDKKVISDNYLDMIYGIDETSEAAAVKTSNDIILLRRMFYRGEWRCMKDNFVSKCSSIAGVKEPFLYSIPLGKGKEPCSQIATNVSFWNCHDANKCIRSGYPCIHRWPQPCPHGYVQNPVDKECVKQVCETGFGLCNGKCIERSKRCNGQCMAGRYYCRSEDKCIFYSKACYDQQLGEETCHGSTLYCENQHTRCVFEIDYKACPNTKNCYESDKNECCRGDQHWCELQEQCISKDKPCMGECFTKDMTLCPSTGKCLKFRNECPEYSSTAPTLPTTTTIQTGRCPPGASVDSCSWEGEKTEATTTEPDRSTDLPCEPNDQSCGVQDALTEGTPVLLIVGLTTLGIIMLITGIALYLILASKQQKKSVLHRDMRLSAIAQSAPTAPAGLLEDSSRYDLAHDVDNEYYDDENEDYYTVDVNESNAYYVPNNKE